MRSLWERDMESSGLMSFRVVSMAGEMALMGNLEFQKISRLRNLSRSLSLKIKTLSKLLLALDIH
jgi:hypothetical protein